jgi:predicted nucleic acid-binding protein
MTNGFLFIDTNVWVAKIIEDHTFHGRAETELIRRGENGDVFCVSSQIIRELISVCTLGRNLSRPLKWEEIQQQLDAMLAQTVFLSESELSTRKLIELGSRYTVIGKQIHDANIVATMLAHGVTRLVTFNPDDFKRFTEIEFIVP